MADKIKKCRLYLGLNQEEFAKKIKVNRSSIMYWENGTRIPKKDCLHKLEKVFKQFLS